MANKPSPKKRMIAMRVNCETCRAVEKKYRLESDTNASIAFIRALEDAVRDVYLSAEDYELIAAEIHENEKRIRGAK